MQLHCLSASLLLLSGPLAAQQQDPVDLQRFELAFNTQPGSRPRIAIACVSGQPPLVLVHGNLDDEHPLSEEALIPLGMLSSFLLGDALHAIQRGDLDQQAIQVGDLDLSTTDLLRGHTVIPPFHSFGPLEEPVSREQLLQCAALAHEAGTTFSAQPSMGEAYLLEHVLLQAPQFAGKIDRIGDALRTALAPHVPGFDPLDAGQLTEPQRALLVPGSAQGTEIDAAWPHSLRLVLTVENIASWLQWRQQNDLPWWVGPRAGQKSSITGFMNKKRFDLATRGPLNLRLHAYTTPEAVLLVGNTADETGALRTAFERCLLGDPELAVFGLGGGRGGRFGGRLAPPLAELARTVWVPADGSDKAKIQIGWSGRADELVFTYGNVWLQSDQINKTKAGFSIQLGDGRDGETTHRLVLVPDGKPVTRLRVAWSQSKGWQQAIPRYLEFVPAAVRKK